jgi:hypothetical protein
VGLISAWLLRNAVPAEPIIGLPLAEVAVELDVSRELLARASGRLTDAGALTLEFGRVLIVDPKVLRSLAEPAEPG